MNNINFEKFKSHFVNHGIILGEYAPNKSVRIMIDPRQALLKGGFINFVGKTMWDKIKKYNPEVIYGCGFGSLNLLIAIQCAAEEDGVSIDTLISRKTRKNTNMHRLVEGPRPVGIPRAVYIDDNMRYGDTFRKTQKDLEEENIKLNTVAIGLLYDFWEYRGSRRYELLGMPVERVLTRHDIGDTRIDPKVMPITEKVNWRNLAHNQWHFKNWSKTAPLIFEDNVFFGNDCHEIFCHNIETGSIQWKYKGHKPLQDKGLSPKLVISNGYLYFSSYDGTVCKLDAITGKVIWKKYVDMFIHSTPYIDLDRNQLYVGTEGGLQNKRGDIVCLDLEDGTTKWITPTKHVVPASPELIHGMVICGSNDGKLYALDPVTGIPKWIIRDIGVIKGKANYIDDVIVVCPENGKIVGIDVKGKILWHRNCGKSTYHQYLNVHRELGLVYITNSDGMVAAYNKAGDQIWIRKLRGSGFWNLQLRGNELISITLTGHASLLDPATGNKIRSNFLGYDVNCPCDFNEEYIAINSTVRGFYLYRRKND